MHSVKGGNHHLHAEEGANLCRLDCSEGTKSNRKYKVHKDNRKMDAKDYCITNIDTKIFGNDIKIKVKGFHKARKGVLYSGILAHYYIHVDPDIGIGKVFVRKISCGCKPSISTKIVIFHDINEKKLNMF